MLKVVYNQITGRSTSSLLSSARKNFTSLNKSLLTLGKPDMFSMKTEVANSVFVTSENAGLGA